MEDPMNHARDLLTSSLIALATLASSPTFAGSRCAAPSGFIDREACAAAAQGPDALRRFIARTKAMWSLWYFDYAGDETRAAVVPVQTRGDNEQVARADIAR
jgi:hypothetical protein